MGKGRQTDGKGQTEREQGTVRSREGETKGKERERYHEGQKEGRPGGRKWGRPGVLRGGCGSSGVVGRGSGESRPPEPKNKARAWARGIGAPSGLRLSGGSWGPCPCPSAHLPSNSSRCQEISQEISRPSSAGRPPSLPRGRQRCFPAKSKGFI